MILFFDVETAGLPLNYKAPVSDVNNWPRLVQIGWILCSSSGEVMGKQEFVIRPEGFVIPEGASNIHGVTQDIAISQGVPVAYILERFAEVVAMSNVIVGHNIAFDMNIVGAEFLRFKGSNDLEGKPTICTMNTSTEFCKLPGKFGKYKWPQLGELYQVLFKTEMGAAHTALQDIENTLKCFFELRRLGVIPQ